MMSPGEGAILRTAFLLVAPLIRAAPLPGEREAAGNATAL